MYKFTTTNAMQLSNALSFMVDLTVYLRNEGKVFSFRIDQIWYTIFRAKYGQ